MKRGLWFGLMLLVVAACGKNDNFRTVGAGVPYSTYNSPYSNPYPNIPSPPTQYPIQWQVPQGQPPQFQPFAPIYNYMQQNYQMQQYWQAMWYQWMQYAAMQQIYVYNFDAFWYNYCPQMWSQSNDMMQVYVYYNNYVY